MSSRLWIFSSSFPWDFILPVTVNNLVPIEKIQKDPSPLCNDVGSLLDVSHIAHHLPPRIWWCSLSSCLQAITNRWLPLPQTTLRGHCVNLLSFENCGDILTFASVLQTNFATAICIIVLYVRWALCWTWLTFTVLETLSILADQPFVFIRELYDSRSCVMPFSLLVMQAQIFVGVLGITLSNTGHNLLNECVLSQRPIYTM